MNMTQNQLRLLIKRTLNESGVDDQEKFEQMIQDSLERAGIPGRKAAKLSIDSREPLFSLPLLALIFHYL